MQIKWHFSECKEIKEPLKKGRKRRVKTDKICQNGRKKPWHAFCICICQKKAVPSTFSPSPMGRDPSKVQSRPADHTQE